MNKKYLLYVLIPVLSATAMAGVAMANNKSVATDPMSGIASVIAQKFNLNTADVQAVFNTERQTNMQERQAEMSQKFAERINKAVADGKLTQAQANLVIAKHTEMQNYMKSLQGKTIDEMQSARKTQMDSLSQWAKDNNIPVQYAQFGGFGGFGLGKGHNGLGMGNCPNLVK